MSKIKFSHNYKKLNAERKAYLICVEDIKLELQTKGFLDYDTEGIYKFPNRGHFILLVFKGKGGTIFTTLRRYTERKMKYYVLNLCALFDIEIITP